MERGNRWNMGMRQGFEEELNCLDTLRKNATGARFAHRKETKRRRRVQIRQQQELVRVVRPGQARLGAGVGTTRVEGEARMAVLAFDASLQCSGVLMVTEGHR